MKLVERLICALLSVVASSCSTTPGDAANRSGHPSQAAELYRRGAEKGDGLAALKLGLMIEEGKANVAEYGAAGKWYVTACEQGNKTGCHNAGVAYEYGAAGSLGLEKDLDRARSSYSKAAERGYMQSQYNLGSMYANRYFDDDVAGLMWMLLAQNAARACVPAPLCKWLLDDPPKHVASLRSRMSAADQALAETRASQWRPQQ